MSPPAPFPTGPLSPRKPLESQTNTGSDMSMMLFVQPDCPSRFAYQDQHCIKGLNAEALARTKQWFFMNGRRDGLESDTGAITQYTIPALIIRDQGYQPILPRNFASIDHFPASPPIIAFTGPIISSGLTLLRKGSITGLDDIQLKCCGFVQLSTFITPRNPNKAPFKGFHPFQIFIIFPIHANP
ncbi:hypothetical protein EDB81DRAFT_849270 [Dactylonectria macrodidyma]|uniref:Uncharacterized protein n=1 Tax=Dactylonectria macrodidyma TaxID=307937 RepID=A0A9P9I7K9_9HYPO|nr:hypothetical protein EDB81DRAFT_849270 [Dactylonectria macrodidyma]